MGLPLDAFLKGSQLLFQFRFVISFSHFASFRRFVSWNTPIGIFVRVMLRDALGSHQSPEV